VKVWKP